MNNVTVTPRIEISSAQRTGGASVSLTQLHDTAVARMHLESWSAAGTASSTYVMTPTEMLLLADQLTAVALQIEARTTQRELPSTILEAA